MKILLILLLVPTLCFAQQNDKTVMAEKEANRKLDSMINNVHIQVKQTMDTVKRKNEALKKR